MEKVIQVHLEFDATIITVPRKLSSALSSQVWGDQFQLVQTDDVDKRRN